MTMSDHTMKAFDTDLQDLSRMVAEMGGLAEKQVAELGRRAGKARYGAGAARGTGGRKYRRLAA